MRYTPAVTMVAAWISAETGVGPSMASGSQVWSGHWADLAAAPTKRRMPITVTSPPPIGPRPLWRWGPGPTLAKMVCRSTVWSSWPSPPRRLRKIRNVPSTSPTSPITWVMNAFRPAATADGR